MPLVILAGGVLALVLVLLLARSNPPAGEVLSRSAHSAPPAAPGRAAPEAPHQHAAAPVATEVAAAAAPNPRRRPTPPIEATFYGRSGAEFNVDPEETIVSVNGRTIGKADDWDGKGGGQTYLFPGAGTYYAKLSLTGYRTAWVKIVIGPGATEEIADIDTTLKNLGEGDEDKD